MNITRALFILRHGSYEGRKKYLEAVQTIEDELNRQKIEIESLKIANEKMYDVNKKQEAEIEEVRYKLECLLCHATGSKLSKSTYSLRTMEAAVTDFMQELDEEVVEEATVNAVKELAEIIVADYPEMEYYLNELVKEFTEGEQK